MLPHYSPLKVAETFSMLAALHPGRIDLGLGRAPGTDPQTMFALQRDRRQASPDDFPEQLAELLAYLEDDFPAAIRSRGSRRCPAGRSGRSSGCSARRRRAGSGRRSSGCRTPSPTSSTRRAPRSRSSTASTSSRRARRASRAVAVAVSAFCAETDEEAQRLAASARMAFDAAAPGAADPGPAGRDGARVPRRAAAAAARRGGRSSGAPATVRAGLEAGRASTERTK